MAATDDTWRGLLDGRADPPSHPHELKQLLVRVRNLSMHPELDLRLEALTIAGRLGSRDALEAAAEFAHDAELQVRRSLMALAADHGQDGLPILRRLASDPDPSLAVEAVRRLTNLQDRVSTSRMRTLLSARHAVVRGRAAVFLGTFGGPSVVPLLRRHEDDGDLGVREAVAWAIATIEGEVDRPAPELGRAGRAAPNPSPSAAPVDGAPSVGDAEASQPGRPSGGSAEPATESAASDPPKGRPSPSSQPAAAEPAPTEPAATRPEASSDAQTQPEESPRLKVENLLRRLATEPSERDAVVEALRSVDDLALSATFRGLTAGEHPDLNTGAALATAELGNPRWLSPIRRLVADPDPDVRAAVATALGALCTPAVYGQLEHLVAEQDRVVQMSAVAALSVGARRLGYIAQARKLLDQLPESQDPALLKARSAARAALEPT